MIGDIQFLVISNILKLITTSYRTPETDKERGEAEADRREREVRFGRGEGCTVRLSVRRLAYIPGNNRQDTCASLARREKSAKSAALACQRTLEGPAAYKQVPLNFVSARS